MLSKRQKHEEAVDVMRQCIEMQQKLPGISPQMIIPNLVNLASLLQRKGDLAAAGFAFDKSLDMARNHFGNNSLDTAYAIQQNAFFLLNICQIYISIFIFESTYYLNFPRRSTLQK